MVEQNGTSEVGQRPARKSRGRFNPKAIEALKPRAAAYEVADPAAVGLALRVHPSGVKSWRWRVRSKTFRDVVSLGVWAMHEAAGFTTQAQAHQWAERLHQAMRAGPVQVAAVEAELKAALSPRPAPAPVGGGKTVREWAEEFLAFLDGARKRPEQARRDMEKDILPVIGHLSLDALRKSDCRAVITTVTGRGAKTHAGKVLALLKQFLGWVEEELEDDSEWRSPAAKLNPRRFHIENNRCDRFLSEAELPIFWRATDPSAAKAIVSRLSDRARRRTWAALRLLLLTGARTGELRLAKWREVDFTAATWTVPVANQKLTLEQAKHAKPFVIPLTPSALGLFEELRELAKAADEGKEPSPWVLASENADGGVFTDKALGKAMRRLMRDRAGIEQDPLPTPHDLRRTCRTYLGKLGIEPHVAERVLNHSLKGMQGIYDRHDYLDARRAALVKWDAFIQRLVSGGSKVAFLPAAIA
jgi:integrase